MTANRSLRIIVLSLAVLLAACGDSGNKIGSTIKGTRVAVIEQAKSLQPDIDVKAAAPTMPHSIVNMSWPEAGYDSEHAMPYAQLSPHLHIVWKQSIGEGSDSDFKLLSTPVIDRGVVYTLDAQGLVSALDSGSGAVLWRHDTTPKDSDEKAIGGGLAIDGETLYVTTGFGDVIALNAHGGTVKWQKPLLKPLRAAPTVADNRIYVVSIDNQMSALNAANGDILWHQEGIAESATLMGASSPAVSGDAVVIAYNSGEIFDLRVQNGRISWNYSLAAATQVGALPAIADIRGLPVIDRGRVYAISHSGRMAAIDARTGDRVWESEIGGIDTPVVAGDAVFVYGGDSQLMALTRDGGRVIWVKQLAKRADPSDKDSDRVVWTGPVLASERLWMVNSLGQLTSFSPADGAAIDSIDLGNPAYLPPIIVNRTLYVTTDDGTLVTLR
jgi:outer membrane protein assembly factor BamB